jgi:hypothetical protein
MARIDLKSKKLLLKAQAGAVLLAFATRWSDRSLNKTKAKEDRQPNTNKGDFPPQED